MDFKKIFESPDAKEDKKKLQEFKKLLRTAYDYGYRNLESNWAQNTVIYALDQVMDDADKLKSQ